MRGYLKYRLQNNVIAFINDAFYKKKHAMKKE